VSPCFISLGFNAEIKQKHQHCIAELNNINIESEYIYHKGTRVSCNIKLKNKNGAVRKVTKSNGKFGELRKH
jgi:hypothetical protein